MLTSPENNLQSLVAKMLIDERYKSAMRKGEQLYQIKQYKIQNLRPQQVLVLHYALASKFYTKQETSSQTWFQNQLRLFVWVLVCYSYQYQTSPLKMVLTVSKYQTTNDWLFFAKIFNNKKLDLLQFQALSIMKREGKFARWTAQEKKLLENITKGKIQKNKWNSIAFQLFLTSDKKFYRSGKQCREFYLNHLDPVTIRKPWRREQDLELIKAVKIVGKKWSKVAKKLHGRRTQHMVKNRFKSLWQLYQKRCFHQLNMVLSQEQLLNEIENRLQISIDELHVKQSPQKYDNYQGKVIGMEKFQSAGELMEEDAQSYIDSFYNQSAMQVGILPSFSPKQNWMYKTNNSITHSGLSLEENQFENFSLITLNNIARYQCIFQTGNGDFN